jgi:transcriptional regulator with XRE-family HTH domain
LKPLNDVIASRSPESQQRIKEMADEMILETGLQMMREELKLSQQAVATIMGISQPAVTQLEQRGNELKIATLKRYIEAMGGKLSLDIELPNGKRVAFHI